MAPKVPKNSLKNMKNESAGTSLPTIRENEMAPKVPKNSLKNMKNESAGTSLPTIRENEMAPKVPKKPLKKTGKNEKNIEKPISKSKKFKKQKHTDFSNYIHKVLLEDLKPVGISSRSMLIMNHFVLDMMERLSVEAGKLVKLSKKKTLGTREVQTAVKLIIPGELAQHALIEGLKAETAYRISKMN